jgi:lipopolysaccharide export system protein LptA
MALAEARVIRQRAALLLLCVPAMAQGLSSDRNQPITIEADSATLHEKEGRSIYKGNVHLQQGTLNLRGDMMTVLIADDEIEKIVLTGQPARYRQRPDDRDSDQQAEAGRIEYHAADERMILLENARVWQSDAEEFRSERIIYNMRDSTVTAGGSSGDRVRITLQPKTRPETDTEPAAAASEPVTPDAEPATADVETAAVDAESAISKPVPPEADTAESGTGP